MRCIIKEAKAYEIDVGLAEREIFKLAVPRSGIVLKFKKDMKWVLQLLLDCFFLLLSCRATLSPYPLFPRNQSSMSASVVVVD